MVYSGLDPRSQDCDAGSQHPHFRSSCRLRKCAVPINNPPATLTDAEMSAPGIWSCRMINVIPIANNTKHSGR
jgi:hypothetical protein